MFEFNLIKPIARVVFAILSGVCVGMCIGGIATMLDYHDFSHGTKVFIALTVLIIMSWAGFLVYLFKTTVFEDRYKKMLHDKINSIYTDID